MGYALIFLVLPSATSLSGTDVLSAFEQAYPGRGAYIREVSDDPPSVVIEVDGARVLVGFATKPLPPAIFEHALNNTESWQEGRPAFASQKSHVLIALDAPASGHKELLVGSTAVTLVAGALVDRLPVSAALVADSELVVEPAKLKMRAREFAEKGTIPVDLWVSIEPFYLVGDDGKETPFVVSRGLKAFVGREIEFASSELSFGELMQKTSDIAAYLIRNGPIVADGHTMGSSTVERIRVKHLPRGLSGEPTLSLTLEVQDPALSIQK